jgi:hypothetical protein
MLRVLIACALLLATAGTASAQHPCDVAQPTSGTVAYDAPPYAMFCQPISDAISAVTVYRSGLATHYTDVVLETPTANAHGRVLYSVALNPMPAGTYVVQVASANSFGEGQLSSTFTVTIGAPPPPPPPPGCTLNGKSYAAGSVITQPFKGGKGAQASYVASLEAQGWALISAANTRKNIWTLTFRCGG